VNLLTMVLLASSAVEQYDRANVLFQQGKFAEAGAVLDAALAADPKLVPALTLKGKLAMALNRFDTARESFEAAVKVAPKSAYAQFLLGFFYYVDNDFNKAIAPLEASLQINPNNPQAHLYLAMTHEGLAQPDKAIAHFERSLAIAESPDTRVAYARLLFSLGRFAESQTHITRALAFAKNARDALYEQGRLHFEAQRFVEAAEFGQKAIAFPGSGTTDRQIHFLLARAYMKLGKTELAEQHMAKFKASGVFLRR
jgi:tetratricopeptide (TPR) repeat protein